LRFFFWSVEQPFTTPLWGQCQDAPAAIAALAAFLPLGLASARAAWAPSSLDVDGPALQQAAPQRMAWEEAKKRKLRHAYWLLEQGDADYKGHRAKAMEEIKKAGEMIGMDLKGEGYGGEKQKWSDEKLREARGLLKDIVDETGLREHEHIRLAIKEIDKALEVK
jgi:hypothetical protein